MVGGVSKPIGSREEHPSSQNLVSNFLLGVVFAAYNYVSIGDHNGYIWCHFTI